MPRIGRGSDRPLPFGGTCEFENPFRHGGITMSAQKAISRREALSLLGVASCAVVLTGSTAQVGADQSQEIIWAVTLRRPQYIFGYGSLIDRHSRIATWASAQF